VCYDISGPKRLKKAACICESFGIRLQFSVFECVLDDTAFQRLRAKLASTIHHELDQVMFVSLGPENGSSNDRFDAIGRPLPEQNRVVVV